MSIPATSRMISKEVVFACLLAIFLFGCSALPATETEQEIPANSPAAVTQQTGSGSLAVLGMPGDQDQQRIRVSAVIEPTESRELSLNTTGRITEILVAAGDRVEAGQLLLRLDSTDLEMAREMAQLEVDAQVAAMQESIFTREQQIARAEINLQLRELELQRFLVTATPPATEADAETTEDEPTASLSSSTPYSVTVGILESQVEAARLELDRLQESPSVSEDQANLDPTEAMIRLEQARLALDQLDRQFEGLEMRAPWDGVIAEVRVRLNDIVAAGEVLAIIVVPNRFHARATSLTEWDLPHVSVGQPATIIVHALPDQTYEGTVSWVAMRPVTDESGSYYPVIVSLERDQQTEALHWGMTADIEIQTDQDEQTRSPDNEEQTP